MVNDDGLFISGLAVVETIHNNWPCAGAFIFLSWGSGCCFAVADGEGFVSRLTDGSGVDICLLYVTKSIIDPFVV